MAELILSTVSTGYNLSIVNNNFVRIRDKINSDLLQVRDGRNTMYQSLDMNNYTITNVGVNPNDPTSLITFGYIADIRQDTTDALNAANAAVITANSASIVANGIDAKATTALSNSATALSTANTANTNANNAVTAVAGKQPLDATLTGIAALTTAADQLVYSSGVDTFSTTALTPFARTLLDDTTVAIARTTLGLGGAAVLNVGTAASTVAAGDDVRLNTIVGTFIDGLQLQWVSGTAITVSGGSAWIPSLSKVVQVSTPIAKTGLTITASTLYHAYLYLNGSTPDVEIVTTAPSAAYLGTARTKTADTSRRYLGSFYSNATGGIAAFYHELTSGFIQINDMTRERSRVLNNGQAIASTNVSFASLVPVSSQRVSCRILNSAPTSPGVIALIGNPDFGAVSTSTSGNYLNSIFAQQDTFHNLSLSTTQQLNYTYTASPGTTGLYLDLQGYYYNR